MTKRAFTDAEAATLRREYEAGKNYREIAEEYGTNENTIRKTVRRVGGVSRPQTREARPDLIAPRKFPQVEDCLPVWQDYQTGDTVAALARKYSCTDKTIATAIRRAGGKLRPLGRPSSWTEQQTTEVLSEYTAGRSIDAIAADRGVSRQALRFKLKREGVLPAASPRLRGEHHGSWKGGKIVVSGYIYVIPTDDDLSYCVPNSLGYVAEHRLIMGRMIGRPLRKTETVHHLNGARRDNQPENLQLRQGNHGKGARLVCGDCGSHNLIPSEI